MLGDRCYDRVEISGNVEAHRLIPSPRLDEYGPSFVVWGTANIDGSEERGFFRLNHEEAPHLALQHLMRGSPPNSDTDFSRVHLALGDQGRVNHAIAYAPSGCGVTFLLLFHAKYLDAHGEIGPVLPGFHLVECEELGFSRSHMIPLNIDNTGLDEFVALSAAGGAGNVYFNENRLEDPVVTTALTNSGEFEFETSCSVNVAGRPWKPVTDSKESVLVLGRDCENAPLSLVSFRPDQGGTLFEQRELPLDVSVQESPTFGIHVVDIDLDGADDALVASDDLLVRVGAAGGDFGEVEFLDASPTSHALYSSNANVVALGAGDFFGSPVREIVVRETSAIALVSTTSEASVRLDIEAEHFSVLDINEDGADDLAASTTTGLVLWISN